jgi:hypothetical protein
MKKTSTVLSVMAAGVLAASSSFAQAAKGENVVMAREPVTTKLASGKTFLELTSHQLCQTADAKHALNGASGPCSGGCLVDATGASTCMGSCLWVDRDSDVAFFTWDGQTSGGWKLAGGSGKWKDASGQGTWASAAPTAGNISRNAWEGTITMKK